MGLYGDIGNRCIYSFQGPTDPTVITVVKNELKLMNINVIKIQRNHKIYKYHTNVHGENLRIQSNQCGNNHDDPTNGDVSTDVASLCTRKMDGGVTVLPSVLLRCTRCIPGYN